MTSRLKHKLELDNVNLNSAYLNESFVQIGTPLPALAETRKDQLEYVPVWKQEVRDEKGRRRLHGAFTGGWSAGYGNTVGSKEGWTPSTFKSSRTERASKAQRPEDFMDEEDLAQMKEDRKLENTETFRSEGLGGTKEELGASRGGVAAFESLIAPAKTSIGQALLQKLGWRPGQGIGPRVTLRKLRIQEAKLGKAVAQTQAVVPVVGEDELDIDESVAGKHTFAPRDSKLLVFDGKDDKEGLGFHKGSGMGSLPQRKATGPAFGVGHIDGEEDDDPYSVGGGISTDTYAFDTTGDDDDVIVMGGPSRHAGLGSSSRVTSNISRKAESASGERWHDGRAMLPGFTLDVRVVVPDKWFEMPEIPKDWRPRPARVWGTKRKWDDDPGDVMPKKEIIRGAPGRPLTFEQRGAALGEDARISKAKSVFEYMSEKDRERLAILALNAPPLPPPPLSTREIKDEIPAAPHPTSNELSIPPLSPRTASAALKGFIPFGDDPAKQDRYRSYLISQCYNTKQPNPTLLPSKNIEDVNKELDDFAASARIFKPMSLAMSSRFTSASPTLAVSDMKQAKPGLHIFDASKAETNDKPAMAEVEVKKDLNPREQAAENGMYGKLTRVVQEFYPAKLLCKRFGVADPHPDGEPAKIPTGTDMSSNGGLPSSSPLDALPLPKNDASWTDKFIHQEGTDQIQSSNPSSGNGSGSLVGILGQEKVPTTLAEVGMGEDVNQGRDTLTYTKPSIDIFKAIFASDDEDDDEDDEGEDLPSAPVSSSKALVENLPPNDPYPPRPDPVDDKPVDLRTFKPVFQRRQDGDDVDGGHIDKEKKKKKDKDKSKKRKGVLSFEVGEEEGEEDAPSMSVRTTKVVDRREKKQKKREGDGKSGRHTVAFVEGGEPEGEGEWVEKPTAVPKVVSKGRLGAADFM